MIIKTVPTDILSIFGKQGDFWKKKHKEEVNSKITVINDLREMVATCMCFEKMEYYDHNSRHSTQSIQDFIMRLRGEISCLRVH